MIKAENLKEYDVNFEDGNWLFETIKSIFSRIDKEKIIKRVEILKKKHHLEKKEKLARRLVKSSAKWSGMAGGATSIPACFPGFGTALQVGGVGVDTMNWLRVQIILILEIAALYDFSLVSQDRMLEIVVILGEATGFNEYARELAKQLAAKRKRNTSILTYARHMTWKIGFYLVKRNILKFIPIIGMITGARRNYHSTGLVGKSAITFYSSKNFSSRK